MSRNHACLAAGFLFLGIFAAGCARTRINVLRSTNPHVYSGGEAAYLSDEEELAQVKAEIARICYTDTLDPDMDSPRITSYDRDYEVHRERCRSLKVRGREIRKTIKRLRELTEEAESEDQPSPDTIRFGDGPLEQVKK